METQDTSTKLIVAVCFDESTGKYRIDIPQGMSANEVAFGVHVIAKCFERDNIMSAKDFMSNIQKYLDDPQYSEVKE